MCPTWILPRSCRTRAISLFVEPRLYEPFMLQRCFPYRSLILVVGRTRRSGSSERIEVPHERHGRTGPSALAGAPKSATTWAWRDWHVETRTPAGIGAVVPFLWSVAAVALATIAGLAMTAVVPLPNVSMVLLLAVLFTAARFGLGPALLASGLSFLAYNFFFIGPLHPSMSLSRMNGSRSLCCSRSPCSPPRSLGAPAIRRALRWSELASRRR